MQELSEINGTVAAVIFRNDENGYGVVREKAEYEDLAALARKSGKTIAQIRSEVLKANKQ